MIWLGLALGIGFGCSPKSSESEFAGIDSVQTMKEVDNALTPAEQAEGWILLFDGNSMQGWRAFNGDTTPSNWVIEEGAMRDWVLLAEKILVEMWCMGYKNSKSLS